MANLEEISDAIETVKNNGNNKIIILHCTSAYPTPTSESNLSTTNEIGRLSSSRQVYSITINEVVII